MAIQNKEYLQELTKDTKAFEGQKTSNIMWDVPTSQVRSEAQSVLSFASNEQYSPLLAKAAWAYKDTAQEYIADLVAPMYPVTSLAGKYRAFNERTFYDRPNTEAGKMTVPDKVNFGSSLTEFTLEGRALSMYLSNVDRDDAINQYGSVAEWKRICTMFLARLLVLDRELSVATLMQADATYAAGYFTTAAPLWSDAAATLQADVMTGEDALLAPRDTLVFGYDAFRQCQRHPAITGATTVSSPKRSSNDPWVNQASIENYFDSKCIVGRARYNSTPGSATPTMSRIWANYVIIAHMQQDPGGAELSAPFIRTFKLQSTSFPNVEGWSVKSVMDGSTMAGGEILMVGYWCDERVFAQKSGYKLKVL